VKQVTRTNYDEFNPKLEIFNLWKHLIFCPIVQSIFVPLLINQLIFFSILNFVNQLFIWWNLYLSPLVDTYMSLLSLPSPHTLFPLPHPPPSQHLFRDSFSFLYENSSPHWRPRAIFLKNKIAFFFFAKTNLSN